MRKATKPVGTFEMIAVLFVLVIGLLMVVKYHTDFLTTYRLNNQEHYAVKILQQRWQLLSQQPLDVGETKTTVELGSEALYTVNWEVVQLPGDKAPYLNMTVSWVDPAEVEQLITINYPLVGDNG